MGIFKRSATRQEALKNITLHNLKTDEDGQVFPQAPDPNQYHVFIPLQPEDIDMPDASIMDQAPWTVERTLQGTDGVVPDASLGQTAILYTEDGYVGVSKVPVRESGLPIIEAIAQRARPAGYVTRISLIEDITPLAENRDAFMREIAAEAVSAVVNS